MSKNGYTRMNECLRSVVRNGTGRSMSSLGAEIGGKTGTTDFKADGRFMGFTPKLVFGAWVGGESKYIHLNLIGGDAALPLCKRFLSKVFADKSLPYKRDDKFEGFVTDLVKIGKKMDEAKSEYGNAMNKLVDGKGNLITSVEKLKKMGAKAKKALPENILKRASDEETDLLEN